MAVKFVELTHQYFDDSNNELYSPSRVLKQVYAFKDFSNYLNDMETKAYIGTKIHKMAENFAIYNRTMPADQARQKVFAEIMSLDPVNEWSDDYKQRIFNYAMSMSDFLQNLITNNIQIIRSECVVSRDIFAGQLDALYYYQNKYILVDYKTSANIDGNVQPLQLAMYAWMLEAEGIVVNEMWLVQITEGEGYHVYKYNFSKGRQRAEILMLNFTINVLPFLKGGD